MIYRGLIGCANPSCYAKLPFAVEIDTDRTDDPLYDEHMQVITDTEKVGWEWLEVQSDEELTVGHYCPRCALGARDAYCESA